MDEIFDGPCWIEQLAAVLLVVGAHALADFRGCGELKDGLDDSLGIAGGVDEAGFAVFYILGLAARGRGDDGEADDPGFLDRIGRGIGPSRVNKAPGLRHGL